MLLSRREGPSYIPMTVLHQLFNDYYKNNTFDDNIYVLNNKGLTAVEIAVMSILYKTILK